MAGGPYLLGVELRNWVAHKDYPPGGSSRPVSSGMFVCLLVLEKEDHSIEPTKET